MPDQTTREERINSWKRSRYQEETRDQYKTLYQQLEEEDAGEYQVDVGEDADGNQVVRVTRTDQQEASQDS